MKKAIISGLMSALLFVVFGFIAPMKGLQPGDKAMVFKLKNTDDKPVTLGDDVSAKGYIVVFTCNTCPVAQAYEQRVIDLNKQFSSKGYPVIAINANDGTLSPGDNFEAMQKRSADKKYKFPYLTDETQDVAGEHQKVWDTHAASWMISGSFNDLIGLKSGYIFRKLSSHSLFKTFVRT
jgi:peroxiredoxin